LSTVMASAAECMTQPNAIEAAMTAISQANSGA
jgi:hypothetical protein